MTTFHESMPKKCPPKDIMSPNGIFWRIVFNDPPIPEDFVIWVLEPENKHELEERKKKNQCNAFAVSMLTEAGISRLSEIFWRGMKKKAERRRASFLGWALVELDSDSGVFKQTGQNPYHFDFWPFISCKLEEKVKEVKGI